ncbi:MAG: VWA domain-containing protein [Acidobacteriota bacterium]
MTEIILTILLVCISGSLCAAQGTSGENAFKVEVRLIQVEVRVTRDGAPVPDLETKDFQIKENGKEQDISFLDYVKAPSEILIKQEDAPSGSEERIDLEADSNPPGEKTGQSLKTSAMEPSWIYLLPEVSDPFEFRRTADAIRDFINSELRPGFYISLGGLPYTDNKDMLLATLDRLEDKPYGKGTGISPEIMQLRQLEDLRRIAQAIAADGSFNTIEDDLAHEPMSDGDLMNAPMISVETVARQIMFYGQLAMFRYMDLVERMALLPGKKSIVLFRSGLRMDRGNNPLMNRLLAAATRNRVSFYTVDARGLDVATPVKDARSTLVWARSRGDKNRPDPMGENNRRKDSEEGLIHLAEETGGQVVLSSNDLGSILTRVVEDSHSYYVLSYYPNSFSARGNFRKIDVSLKDKKGFRVSAVKGYYEPKPIDRQSSNERLLSLKETMQTSISRDLRISGEPEVLVDPDGKPLLYLSIGVPAEDFHPDRDKKTSEIEAEILLQVTNHYSLQMPLYHNDTVKRSFTREELSAGQSPRVTYQTMLPLAPGYYHLKGIIRDKKTGVHGIYASSVVVRDLKADSVPSSLILTKYAAQEDQDVQDDLANRVLSAGGNIYYPQPDHEFRKGDIIYAVFHVYNATPEDFEWAANGVQAGLLKDDQPVKNISIYGNPLPEKDSRVIRYVLVLETAELDPGEYTFMALLPNYPSRSEQHLEEQFTLRP